MSTKKDLLADAKKAEEKYAEQKENFKNIKNLDSQEAPSPRDLQVAEYWAQEYARTIAAVYPDISAEDLAYKKLCKQKDILEGEYLKTLGEMMDRELKDPERQENRRKDDIHMEQECVRVKKILDDMQSAKKEPDYANIVNAVTGRVPTELELQAAEYSADQYMRVQHQDHPELSDEELKKNKIEFKKALLEEGDLKSEVDTMLRELKNPDEISKRHAREDKTSAMLRSVFKEREA